MTEQILAVDPKRRYTWQAVADLRALGYIRDTDHVLDATVGAKAGFWTRWRPGNLVTNDADPAVAAAKHYDYRCLGFANDCFDVVVFDPDFKLTGNSRDYQTGSGSLNAGYGLNRAYKSLTELFTSHRDGLFECLRVTKPGGYLWYKTQDQVACDTKHWLTKMAWRWLDEHAALVDEIFIYGYRAQPANRTKKCARCSGTGKVAVRAPSVNHGHGYGDDCGACEGSGRVPSTQHHVHSSTSVIQVFQRRKS